MEYHVPSWAVVKTWRDENLLSLYVVYTCFDGFRRNKEIVPAEREQGHRNEGSSRRKAVGGKGLLDEIQYSRFPAIRFRRDASRRVFRLLVH